MITDKQLERFNNLLRSAWPKDALTPEATIALTKLIEGGIREGVAGTDLKLVRVDDVEEAPPPPPPSDFDPATAEQMVTQAMTEAQTRIAEAEAEHHRKLEERERIHRLRMEAREADADAKIRKARGMSATPSRVPVDRIVRELLNKGRK